MQWLFALAKEPDILLPLSQSNPNLAVVLEVPYLYDNRKNHFGQHFRRLYFYSHIMLY